MQKTVHANLLSAEVIAVLRGLVGILRVAQNDSVGFSTVVDEILRVAQNDR